MGNSKPFSYATTQYPMQGKQNQVMVVFGGTYGKIPYTSLTYFWPKHWGILR